MKHDVALLVTFCGIGQVDADLFAHALCVLVDRQPLADAPAHLAVAVLLHYLEIFVAQRIAVGIFINSAGQRFEIRLLTLEYIRSCGTLKIAHAVLADIVCTSL